MQSPSKFLSLVGYALLAASTLPAAKVQAQGAPYSLSTRYMGMNVAQPGDNVRAPIFANVAKTGRYGKGSTNFNTDTSVLDRNGNLNQDFDFYLLDTNYGILNKHGGTYTISFTGKGTVTPRTFDGSGGTGTVAFISYANNVTTYKLTLPNTALHPFIMVMDTDRDGVGLNHDGVTNLRVMRPVSPDSTTSYTPDVVYTSEFLNLNRFFNVTREMSNINDGGNDWEKEWTQRVLPSEPQNLSTYISDTYGGTSPRGTWKTGRGLCWEYQVRRANDSDTDLHLNIPIAASNDYITKLAQLIYYGSDGVNPYTSAQGSPVWAPLEAGRNVYFELGNEVWNSSMPYWYNYNYAATQSAAAASNDPIRYDNTTNTSTLRQRWLAKRTVEMSNLLRGVFGNSQLPAGGVNTNSNPRVRPVLMWQQGNANNIGREMLSFLHNWFNNGSGPNVGTPRPVNYYIWGGGGTFYNDPTDASSVNAIFASWDQTAWARSTLAQDVVNAKTFGLAAFDYEGGPSLGGDNGGNSQVFVNAWSDARMKGETIDTQYAFEEIGGDGGNGLTLGAGNPATGATGSTFNYTNNWWSPTATAPKMQAVDELNNTSAKRAPTGGNPTGPTAFRANAFVGSSNPTAASTGYVGGGEGGAKYYLVRAPAGTYKLRIRYGVWGGNTTQLKVLANGFEAGSLALVGNGNPETTTQWSSDLLITLGAGMNGVRLVSNGGYYGYDILIDAYAAPTPATLAPGADTYVRDGTFANDNYGSQAQLQVKKIDYAGSTRHTYLKFDTASFSGTASSVKLRLYGGIEQSSGNVDVQVAGVSNTTWSETGLTWNNAPTGSVGSVLQTKSLSTTQQYYEWDVTGYVNTERAAGRNTVCLRLISNTINEPRVMLNSREAASNKPQLVLTP